VPESRATRWTLALALLGALCAGCQHGFGRRDACTGAFARADAPRTLHLRVLLEHDGSQRRHEAVVQVEPGRIRVQGLTPMGTRAFTLSHEQGRIALDERVARHLGQRPRLVYDAIAHAFLAPPPAAADEPAAALSEPVAASDEPVAAARADAPVVLREPGPPPSVRVRNPGCGYDAWLVVLSDDEPAARGAPASR
jgi:hypothetical protein